MEFDELNKNLLLLFFYHVLIFFMGMTNIITLFSDHTIKFENGLSNLDYNSKTVYSILINDTPKDAYENCLQGMTAIFFIRSRISEFWI